MCQNVAPTVFHTQNIRLHEWKTLRTTLWCFVVLQLLGEGLKSKENCHTVYLNFMTFTSQLETNDALQCSSDNFPHIVIYVLCVENCQNYILTHSGLLIVGRPFYNVRKFHAPRISECNISFLPIFKVWIQYAKFPDRLAGCFAVTKKNYVCYGKKLKKAMIWCKMKLNDLIKHVRNDFIRKNLISEKFSLPLTLHCPHSSYWIFVSQECTAQKTFHIMQMKPYAPAILWNVWLNFEEVCKLILL